MPEWNAVKTAPDLSFADSALVEAIACGLHALRRLKWKGGERILILGTGAMAVAISYWARRMGAGRIVAVSRYPHRNNVLLSMGVDAVMSTEDNDATAFYEALGGPPDIVAECVGKRDMVAKAIALTPPEKVMISMGMCAHSESINPAGLAFRDITMMFPVAYTYAEYVETIRAFEKGSVRPEWIVSDVITLDEVPDVLEQLRAGTRRSFKVQVNPHA
jgi:(R,R)-butanediol dehydrogenase/meso-butanediol dehydrogenase/diacetyl reductase